MGRVHRITLITILAILIASLAIGGSGSDVNSKSDIAKDDFYNQLEIFADAISLVKNEYVDDVEAKKLMRGAMKGMLSNLDDYSQFMEPEELKEIEDETKGQFSGIGIEISLKDGILTVVTPIIGTPAQAAGIKPGDKIIEIDGKVTKNITLDEAVKKMRGKAGTKVTLTLWRDNGQKIIEVPIRRAIIKIKSVKDAEFIDGKIGYISLIEFHDNTARDFDDALKKLESQGMDSLILDLRYNPGGILDAAVDVSERFLPKEKVIVSLKSRTPGQSAQFRSSGKFTHPDYPMIILVNGGSASASEIVSGALQDNKRALILGTKTYGKASVQTIIPLRDGSALRLTTASYITPSGKLIKNQGIVPDIIVEEQTLPANKSDKSEASEDLFDKVSRKDGRTKDTQLNAAINLIKAIKIYKGEKK